MLPSLMNDEDREALQLNKFETSISLYDLQDKIKRQPDLYRKEFESHFVMF
jgi:hypothetical protein